MNGVADPTIVENVAASAPADEVDDFEVVSVFEDGLGPTVTGGDFAVEFDGDAVGLHIEGFDEKREGELGGGGGFCEGAGVSVDVQLHGGTNLVAKADPCLV
jgi:hypothetical protein